jgi:hypothetical protein
MKRLNFNFIIFIGLALMSSFGSSAQKNDEMDKVFNDYKNHKISFEEYKNAVEQETRNKLRSFDTRKQENGFDKNENESSTKNNYQTAPEETANNSGKIVSFDTKATNFDRFENSPCYDEIGFNPTWDLTSLEKRYSECENAKNLKTVMNVLYIFAFVLIIGIVFYFSRKKRT